LNRRDRVLMALNFEEPDMVPISEFDIEIPHIEKLTGERFEGTYSLQSQVSADRKSESRLVELKTKCYRKLGFDILFSDLSAPDEWKPTERPDGSIVDEWGRVLIKDSITKAWLPSRSIFETPEDFEEFLSNPPDPYIPGRTFAVEYTKKLGGDDMALGVFIRDPFAHVWEILTPTTFVRWMYERPELLKRGLDTLTEFNIGILKRLGEIGVDLVVSGGDYCEMKGPMVPVKFFKEAIFPGLRRQVEAAHKQGLTFLKHTDGNVTPLLEYLADIVDGVHSLDPSAGVDIGAVKARYGDRLVLMGNVSVDNLALKDKKDIIQETKECIRSASPGGGHILSSSNSWYTGAKLENCLVMVETGRKFGKYPIRI